MDVVGEDKRLFVASEESCVVPESTAKLSDHGYTTPSKHI